MKEFDPDAAAKPGSGVFGLNGNLKDSRVVLVPVPFDATASYRQGAALGPTAILGASHQVDLFDLETGRPYEAGICMLKENPDIQAWNQQAKISAAKVFEAGGAEGAPINSPLYQAAQRVNHFCRQLFEWVYNQVKDLLQQGHMPCVVGGDHSVALPAMSAYAERFPQMGVLHVDAHADLRQAYEGLTYSHASVMYNLIQSVPAVSRLVQVAVRDVGEQEVRLIENSSGRIITHFDVSLAKAGFSGRQWNDLVKQIISDLPAQVYVSFDIDGLEPSLCPGTGTPVPGGLSFPQANALLAEIVQSGRTLVGFDLCEVAPRSGTTDEWDGNVGARLLYKLIGWALLSQSRGR